MRVGLGGTAARLNVERLLIEQSVRQIVQEFGLQPNAAQTWVAVNSAVSQFLMGLWRQGKLVGSKPAEAYAVRCGLGDTMTQQDILNSIMIVLVSVAVRRPAEFIEFTVQQNMTASA